MSELSKLIREDQKKEDDLERTIRDMERQSKKGQSEETVIHPKGKRMRMDNNYRNYEGSPEGLLSVIFMMRE